MTTPARGTRPYTVSSDSDLSQPVSHIAKKAGAAEQSVPEARAKILIVDDSAANLLALEAVLEPLGHDLVRARSGAEALEQVQLSDFAAILLDVHMPGLDGFKTAALVKKTRPPPATPSKFSVVTTLAAWISSANRSTDTRSAARFPCSLTCSTRGRKSDAKLTCCTSRSVPRLKSRGCMNSSSMHGVRRKRRHVRAKRFWQSRLTTCAGR